MGRFFTSWHWFTCTISLAFCCVIASNSAHGSLLQPKEYLRALEPAPNSMELFDFLDIYETHFTQCKDMESYAQALSYLVDNGEIDAVRIRMTAFSRCPSLSRENVAVVARLDKKIQFALASTLPAPAVPSSAIGSEKTTPPASITATTDIQTEKELLTEKKILPSEAASLPTTKSKKTSQRKKIARVAPKPPARNALLKEAPVSTLHVMPSVLAKGRDGTQGISIGFAQQQYFKDGDKSTSRLFKSESTLTLGLNEDKVKASINAIYLTAGAGGKIKDTGSSYLSEKKHTLKTHDTVFVPELSYKNSGLLMKIGSSPLGGTVSPLPTARVAYTTGPFSMNVHHESVVDSLLSYVGFRDIYTDKKMGRVMRTGGKLAWQDALGHDWFSGISASGAYFYGENVKENTECKSDVFLGKTFGDFAAGIYLSADHFSYNLNNFTYGHGGYYSPHLAASAAGFISWEHRGKMFQCKIDTSLGHLYEEIRNTSKYFRSSGKGNPFTGSCNNNFTSNSGIEASIALQENIQFSVSGRFLTSNKYYEGKGGLELKIKF